MNMNMNMNISKPVIRPMQPTSDIPVIILPIQEISHNTYITPPTTPLKSQRKSPPILNQRYRPYARPYTSK
jgi:hypothetical protein